MKKNIIIISTIIILVILGIIGFNTYNYYKIKNAKINIELIDNLNIEFNTKVYLSDIIKKINGTYIDQEIPTTKLGENTIKFNYINDDKIKVSKDIKYNVVDTIPPFINLPSKYSVIVGSEDNLLKNIMCADNIDDNPSCSIEGEYNLEEVGSYPLIFKAVDKSGNETIKEFELIVKENHEVIEEEKNYSKDKAKQIGIDNISKELKSQINNEKDIVNEYINTNESEEYIEVEVIYEVLENIGTEEKIAL